MTEKCRIGVTMGPDGKTPQRVLVFDNVVIGEMSYLDTVALIHQATGTLVFDPDKHKR